MAAGAAGAGQSVTRLVCVHGSESSGKTTLSTQLAAHYGAVLVPEYGRTYCEEHGLDLAAEDLLAIGRTQSALTRDALARTDGLAITDTDALTTAAWSIMAACERVLEQADAPVTQIRGSREA